MHRVGVDVGGTFTDVVVYDETTGSLTVGKSPTTAADLALRLLHALANVGVALPATGSEVHGATIRANAIREATGATVWVPGGLVGG